MESTENTQPIVKEDERPPEKKKKPRRWRWILLGIFALLIVGAIAGYFGYQEALKARLAEQDKHVLAAAAEQFELGVQELESEQFDNARKRFEYVIQIMPSYPGAQEKLTEVMLAQANVATPTPVPTPTLTPTPDLRGEQDLYNHVVEAIQNEEWDEAVLTLDALRELNINYRTIDVDGLYYITLRNRGVSRILNEGSLEPGIYDLALAEGFAPLDVEADNYRSWARRYLNGASYWGLDWVSVVNIFGELYGYLPYLRDSSGMTTTERYRQGLINWGDQFFAAEEWCLANEKYEMSLALMEDASVSEKAKEAYEECHRPEEEATKAAQQTATAEALLPPTETPTQEAVQPTATPVPPTAVPAPTETTPPPEPTPEPTDEGG